MLFNLPTNYFDLLWVMTRKEFVARYKKAVFGFLWVILNPILEMLIIGTVFAFMVKIENYYLFLFAGLLPWQFFSLSLSKTTMSLVYDRSLLKKTKFPTHIIPLSTILANYLNLLIAFLLLIIFQVITFSLNLPNVFLLLPALIWLFCLTTGMSLIATSLNVFYRDINFFIQTALILWFYLTPILYQINALPSHLKPLFSLNPLVSPIMLFQTAILKTPAPSTTLIFFNLIISLTICFLGVYIYKHKEGYFIDYL